ncbi:MAG TPA: hypothetical protein VFQ95_04455 [Rhodanobacteraceae bacterium]|nr:hypothetical protein [Rhodanobacteraceae bacterium]
MNLLRNFFRARLAARPVRLLRRDRRREWKVTVPAPRAPAESQRLAA